jgi:hypothetical protein
MSYDFPFNQLSDYQFKHMDAPLLLPEELGRIVNAFAKPCLRGRYKKTYNDVLAAFGLKRWPELGRKLCEENHLLWMLLKVFLVAKKNADRVENDVREYRDEEDPTVYYTQGEADDVRVYMHGLLQEVYGTSRNAVLVAVYGKTPPDSWSDNYV